MSRQQRRKKEREYFDTNTGIMEVKKDTKKNLFDVKKHFKFKNDAQKEAYETISTHDISFLSGPAGTAKAQPLDAIVYCPSGPKKMGELKVGEEVCTPYGKRAKITGVFPQGEKDIYRIEFTDGDSTECCEDHLWKISSESSSQWKNKIVDTKYLKENYKSPNGRNKFTIETPTDVFFCEKKIDIDPYLLGYLIGDGCLSNSTTFATADEEVVEKISMIVHPNFKISKLKDKYSYSIINVDKKNSNSLTNSIRKYKLNVKSDKKFIPDDYKYNIKEVRLKIIQGLMDSDGTTDAYCSSFCTVSEKLANDFKEIIESLGGKCSISEYKTQYEYNGEKKQGLNAYKCYPKLNDMKSLFDLSRKKDIIQNKTKYKVKRTISNIEYVGKKEAKCIMIDSKDHLYLTNNFIVTHNTMIAVAHAVEEFNKGKYGKIIITRPVVEAAEEKLGHLPGTFEEKIGPYLVPIVEFLVKFLSESEIKTLFENNFIQAVPIAFMRGRTFSDSFIIVDEAQNCSLEQLKLAMSRIGEGSKMVITGDPEQSDIKHKNCYAKVVEGMKCLDGIGVAEFSEEHIVRHPQIAKVLNALGKIEIKNNEANGKR